MENQRRNTHITGLSLLLLAASGALFVGSLAAAFMNGGVGTGAFAGKGKKREKEPVRPWAGKIDHDYPLFIG
jgi:hypothetical protein